MPQCVFRCFSHKSRSTDFGCRLFLEKVRKHPEYNTVPVKDRAMNQEMLRDVLPKAEALKVKLLERYKAETLRYLADAKQREKAELERAEQERKRRYIFLCTHPKFLEYFIFIKSLFSGDSFLSKIDLIN